MKGYGGLRHVTFDLDLDNKKEKHAENDAAVERWLIVNIYSGLRVHEKKREPSHTRHHVRIENKRPVLNSTGSGLGFVSEKDYLVQHKDTLLFGLLYLIW